MDIKSLSKKTLDFTIKRVAEIIGIFLIIISILLFLALLTYSPEDPNFIFTENTTVKNILGFKGSYTSDLFFQSIGLVSFFISFTIFFTGLSILKESVFVKLRSYTISTSIFLFDKRFANKKLVKFFPIKQILII